MHLLLAIYSGSKAALLALSETARLEFRPWGVRVLSVMTGAIQTQAFQEKYELSPDSLYAEYKDEIAAQAEGSRMGSRTPARKFAQSVLDDVISGRNGIVYRGHLSSFAFWVGQLMPRFLRVSSLDQDVEDSHMLTHCFRIISRSKWVALASP